MHHEGLHVIVDTRASYSLLQCAGSADKSSTGAGVSERMFGTGVDGGTRTAAKCAKGGGAVMMGAGSAEFCRAVESDGGGSRDGGGSTAEFGDDIRPDGFASGVGMAGVGVASATSGTACGVKMAGSIGRIERSRVSGGTEMADSDGEGAAALGGRGRGFGRVFLALGTTGVFSVVSCCAKTEQTDDATVGVEVSA